MIIRAMMLVKDEADVVGEVLRANAEWCDRIYIIDNGSTDGSWEIIKDLSASIPAVVPFARELQPFSDGLRGVIFEAVRRDASPGDWWCKMDADEIYIDDPRAFLQTVPARYRRVWNSSYQYFFTDRDLERYDEDPAGFLATPVEERIRYYRNSWSEPRFFRHTNGLRWPRSRDGRFLGGAPVGVFGNYPRRIRLKHYQFRSPEQIQRRLTTRLESPAGEFVHEKLRDWRSESFSAEVDRQMCERGLTGGAELSWRDRVVPAELLEFDARDGVYIEDPSALPDIPSDRFRVRELASRGRAWRWRLVSAARALGVPKV